VPLSKRYHSGNQCAIKETNFTIGIFNRPHQFFAMAGYRGACRQPFPETGLL
jgi:hypothetical protein